MTFSVGIRHFKASKTFFSKPSSFNVPGISNFSGICCLLQGGTWQFSLHFKAYVTLNPIFRYLNEKTFLYFSSDNYFLCVNSYDQFLDKSVLKNSYQFFSRKVVFIGLFFIFFVGHLHEDAPIEEYPGNLTILLS